MFSTCLFYVNIFYAAVAEYLGGAVIVHFLRDYKHFLCDDDDDDSVNNDQSLMDIILAYKIYNLLIQKKVSTYKWRKGLLGCLAILSIGWGLQCSIRSYWWDRCSVMAHCTDVVGSNPMLPQRQHCSTLNGGWKQHYVCRWLKVVRKVGPWC